jgi:hypothetical protein
MVTLGVASFVGFHMLNFLLHYVCLKLAPCKFSTLGDVEISYLLMFLSVTDKEFNYFAD